MIECKEDVVLWFRQLESFHRIDAMCALLNCCLPFELRFLGTYLENLASRDYEELRRIELQATGDSKYTQELFEEKGPTPRKIRMMGMFLALIRTLNRKCCNDLYKTLHLWGRQELVDKYSSVDELRELLVIYIMAKNHPVLAFEQRLKCAEIFQVLYDQMAVSGQTTAGSQTPVAMDQQELGNAESPSDSTPSSPTTTPEYVQTPILIQQQQQQQQPTTQVQMTYHPLQQQHLHGVHQQQMHHPLHHHVHAAMHQPQAQVVQTTQFLDSSPQSQQMYAQHPQLIQTTTPGGQPQQQYQQQTQQLIHQQTPPGQQQAPQQQQQQQHIQVHPGIIQSVTYPQLIQTSDGLSQAQQSIGIMEQYQTVAAVPQPVYHENAYLAGTTVSAGQMPQNIVQWQTNYRPAAPPFDKSIPPPQIPNLPQSSTSSSSSLIISQSSSPTHSRTTSPVRVQCDFKGNSGGGSQNMLRSGQPVSTKRSSRRPSADQTTPPPSQADLMASKTYDENPEILRNGYARQPAGSRLGKTYSVQHHHHQQQQQQAAAQQQQFQHIASFHMAHGPYSFINHPFTAHHQPGTLIAAGHPQHALDYATYSGGNKQGPPHHVPLVETTTGNDSGSNSNDDISPSETPPSAGVLMGGGHQVLVAAPPSSSALQTRLLNTQLGNNKAVNVVYMNNASPNSNSGGGGVHNSSSNTTGSGSGGGGSSSANNGGGDLGAGPSAVALSSSPSPVSGGGTTLMAVGPQYVPTTAGNKGSFGGRQQYHHQGQMISAADMIPAEFAPYNNHFLHHNAHMLRTTGAPPNAVAPTIQSPPPPPQTLAHIPGMMMAAGGGQLINYSVLQAAGPAVAAAPAVEYAAVSGGSSATAGVPKSCFNCGSQAHAGLDCRESSMEDAIHHANYKLDYKVQQQLLMASDEMGEAELLLGSVAEGNEDEPPEEQRQQRLALLASEGMSGEAKLDEQQQHQQRSDGDSNGQPRLRRMDNTTTGTGESSNSNELAQRFSTLGMAASGMEQQGGEGPVAFSSRAGSHHSPTTSTTTMSQKGKF